MTILRHSLDGAHSVTQRLTTPRIARTQPLLWWAALSAAAGSLAWLLGSLPLISQPVPSSIAAVLTVTLSVRRSVRSGGTLLLATTAALAAAWILYHLFGIHFWTVGILIAVALGLGTALRLTPEASLQVPVTALFLYALGDQLDNYTMVARVAATLLGVGIGIAFSLLARPIDPYDAQKRALDTSVGELLEAIGDGCSQPYTQAQARQWLDASRTLLAQAHTLQEHRGTNREKATSKPDREVQATVHTAELLNAIARSLSDAVAERDTLSVPAPVGNLLTSAGSSFTARRPNTGPASNPDAPQDQHEEARRAAVGEVKALDDTAALVLSASILADVDQLVAARATQAHQGHEERTSSLLRRRNASND